MTILPAMMFFILSFNSANIPSSISNHFCVDSVFVNWNKATFQSLNRQIETITDGSEKDTYKNRLLLFADYLEIKNAESMNMKSIRYRFLAELFTMNNNRYTPYYVIEANRSGESVTIRNFVIYQDSINSAIIEFYNYVNGKWRKTGGSKITNFGIVNDLKQYFIKFGQGVNHDDIIITKFENKSVKESEYYVPSTLSIKSGINEVLNSYKKENFIK